MKIETFIEWLKTNRQSSRSTVQWYSRILNRFNDLSSDDELLQIKESYYRLTHTDENFYCPICFKEGNENFSISKCNHILCNECWAQWIFEKMECPLCKKKVRFQIKLSLCESWLQ